MPRQSCKTKALCLQLAFPREWEDTWVHEVKKISKVIAKGKNTVYYYKGELEQIHGVAEAKAFIKKGKYVESEDSDGDIVYKKTRKYEDESIVAKNEAEMQSSTHILQADGEKVLEAMELRWEDEGSGSSGAGSNLRDGEHNPTHLQSLD